MEIPRARLGAWAGLGFFRPDSPDLARVLRHLGRETRPVLPPAGCRFRALELTPPEAVRVVILGQDPYPTPGHANGLAFSVAPGVALPRSLANIFAEMRADIGRCPDSGDLSHWARQGVLLLNAVLTVPAGRPGGHRGIGWEALAQEILAHVSTRPTAFLLWGRPAQAMARHIRPGGHLVLTAAHPSPLSARRGFFGSRPFSRVNEWLAARGGAPIAWA